jgi:hypothetical protein
MLTRSICGIYWIALYYGFVLHMVMRREYIQYLIFVIPVPFWHLLELLNVTARIELVEEYSYKVP